MAEDKKRLHDLDVDAFLAESVEIEPLAIEEEYVRIPSDLAYWGARYSDALKASMKAKHEEEKTYARLRMEKREELLGVANAEAANDPKKKVSARTVTESMVDAEVTLDPAYETAHIAFIEAEAERVRLHGVLKAVETKREMLVSLGAHVRQEMQNDPLVREQVAGHRAVQGQKGTRTS